MVLQRASGVGFGVWGIGNCTAGNYRYRYELIIPHGRSYWGKGLYSTAHAGHQPNETSGKERHIGAVTLS